MSDSVTLTIDGKEISVAKGTSVIEAAKAMGVEIPHFCWHPGLSVAGVCRFCMVKIEGVPKLQISCNTICTEGMKVVTKSEEVKEAHKWALEFHLINHPLDCPICDQAGECELQNFYMKVGKYTSQMDEDKVLKPKALDVGDNLVLDTERCILCSRCVRFEDEVTKTGSLGIFNRGDHAVIGTFPDKKIQHNYSYNLVDICPVGAFTAKDFRFRCRVWFLSETQTICPGCSTGCSVTLFQNKNQRQFYRLKPRHNPKVNGHWMCDYGRTLYRHLNAEERLAAPMQRGQNLPWAETRAFLAKLLQPFEGIADKVAVVFTPQNTNEEYHDVLTGLKRVLGGLPTVYVWTDPTQNPDDFDGLLLRGDRSANRRGLVQALAKHGIAAKELDTCFVSFTAGAHGLCLVFGPEIESSYANFQSDLSRFAQLENAVYFGNTPSPVAKRFSLTVPTQTFAEKNGAFVNFQGIEQRLQPARPVFPDLLDLASLFSEGKNTNDVF